MKYILLSLSLFIVSCSITNTGKESIVAVKPALDSNEVSVWMALTGKWYGSQEDSEGRNYEWTVSRTEEGVFKLESKRGDDEKYIELGEWGVSAPIYFVITKGWFDHGEFVPADPTDPYLRHAYEILSISEQEFRYKAFSDGSIFRMIKVPDDYQF